MTCPPLEVMALGSVATGSRKPTTELQKENPMRKIVLLSLVFVFLFAVIARAEETIVIFDKDAVIAQSEALKAARGVVESKFGGQRDALEKERAELEQQAAGFQRQAPTEKQVQDFMRQQEEFSEKAQAFSRLLQADNARIGRDMDMLIGRTAKELAERKGYVLVLDSAAVAYFDPKLDVTAEMLDGINALWKKETGR